MRAIYIRDDLDGYAGMIDSGYRSGPPAGDGAARTVTTVTLTYQPPGGMRALDAVAVGYPMPADALAQGPHVLGAWARDPMLLLLTTSMTAGEVRDALRGTDPGHHAGITTALATLSKSVGEQWHRDLDMDTDQPTRPTLTLDRDREAMPSPDPDHMAQDRAMIGIDLAALDALRALVADAIGADGATDPVPGVIRQQTAWAVDLAGQALTDAPTGRGWSGDDQAGNAVHRRPGNTGQVSVGDGRVPGFALAAIREAMPRTGTHGIALLQTVITMARDAVGDAAGGIVTVNLDDLARRVHGQRARGVAETGRRRAWAWDQVRLLASLRVEGQGPRSRIRTGGKMVEMAWYHPLIVVEGVLAQINGQIALDGMHGIPVAVRIRASDRLASDARLGNRAMPVLGELGRVMTIPAGQPGGSWARAITHALVFQARRQRNCIVMVSRQYLLTHYPGDPHPMDLLGDRKRMRRAVEYWEGALQAIGMHLPDLIVRIDDPEAPTGRGWSAQWLAARVLVHLSLDAPEMAGLRDLIAGRAVDDDEAAYRRDRAAIKADTIRKRGARAAPTAP